MPHIPSWDVWTRHYALKAVSPAPRYNYLAESPQITPPRFSTTTIPTSPWRPSPPYSLIDLGQSLPLIIFRRFWGGPSLDSITPITSESGYEPIQRVKSIFLSPTPPFPHSYLPKIFSYDWHRQKWWTVGIIME